jgi:hypothetical protein
MVGSKYRASASDRPPETTPPRTCGDRSELREEQANLQSRRFLNLAVLKTPVPLMKDSGRRGNPIADKRHPTPNC